MTRPGIEPVYIYIYIYMCVCVCVCVCGEVIDLVNPTISEKISGKVDKPKN